MKKPWPASVTMLVFFAACTGTQRGASPSVSSRPATTPTDPPSSLIPSPPDSGTPSETPGVRPSATASLLPPALRTSSPRLRPVGANNDPKVVTNCRTDLGRDGFYFGCSTLRIAGGTAMWVWYTNKTSPFEWIVEIRRYVPAAGAWVVVLRATLPADQKTLRVSVRHSDISDSAHEDLLVGYVHQGGASLTEYDVVSWPAGIAAPYVRFDRHLRCGLVQLSTGEIQEWAGGAASVCPADRYLHTSIRYVSGQFRIVTQESTTASDGSDF